MRLFLMFALMGSMAAPPCRGEIDLGYRTSHTPYDSYMGGMRRVFARFKGNQPTMEETRAYLRTARRFRYYYDDANPYSPTDPSVTDSTRQGDCKAKSLWLAWKMDDNRLRFVLGKIALRDVKGHAWLLWQDGLRWYALDPTMESDLLQADKIAGRKLFPRFSYTASSAFKHDYHE